MTRSPFATLRDYTVWPCPGVRMDDLEWRLRYLQLGELTREDALLAASVVSAYRELIMVTGDRRSKVVSQLKREAHERREAPGETSQP